MKKKKRVYLPIEKTILALVFKRSEQTICRWIKNDDDRLKSDKARKALTGKIVLPV